MNKLGLVVIKDVALTGLAVALWSPVIGLSPFDTNILKAAAAVTSYIAVPAAAVIINKPLLMLGEDEFVTDIATSGEDTLLLQLQKLGKQRNIAGKFASETARQIVSARDKKDAYVSMLSNTKLAVGSIAWSRYAGVAERFYVTIRSTSKNILSNLKAFDIDDYLRLSKLIESGDYTKDYVSDDVQIERLGIYEATLDRIKEMVSSNERLLLEFDKLISEIASNELTPKDIESEAVLQTMRTLIDESKLYDTVN